MLLRNQSLLPSEEKGEGMGRGAEREGGGTNRDGKQGGRGGTRKQGTGYGRGGGLSRAGSKSSTTSRARLK